MLLKNHKTLPALQQAVAQILLESLFPKAQHSQLLLSGGRTPQGILAQLQKTLQAQKIAEFNVYWLDERYVPHESEESNFGNAYRFCFQNLKGPKLFPFATNLSLPDCIQNYEKTLLEEGELPIFDLALFGLGPDGHIASLFSREDDKEDQLVVSTKSPDGRDRLSLTSKVFNRAKRKILIGSGPEKKKILDHYLTGTQKELPIHLLSKEGLEVHWVDSHPER